MIRLHGGLCEDFTRRLTCQQADERQYRFLGLPTGMPTAAACATSDVARLCSPSGRRPVP
jgi:hypothetical protein